MVRPTLGQFLRTSLPLLAASALITACGNKDKGGSPDKTDDGSGGTEGMGGAPTDPPTFIPTACEEDSDCNDYFYCNGEERCIDNVCRQGELVDCDDGLDCTVDRCVEDGQECESQPPDEDGDGHAAADCEGEDGSPLGDDCDDDDSLSYPGSLEVCDPEDRDEDCDPETFGQLDSDQDGYFDAMCCNADEDGDLNCGNDCDDKKTNVNPAATEACDFLDNNCDGETDEGVSISVYEDKDHDGKGDDDAGTVQSCAGAVGYAVIAGDCDDEDPEVFTGQFEICDDKDNNCNGVPDEVRELAPWYKDLDGDGYGDAESTPVLSCYRIPGRVLSQNDCNDGASTVNPNATEVCDGLDNNCNGAADFKLPGNNNFEDDDSDSAADAECGGDDCNDTDARTSSGAEEVCDRIDNDCDGEVDEQTVQNIWYIDEDGDGWGVVIGSALASCDPIPDRASQFGDCDDTDRDVKPGSQELCDGFDNDCDGEVDEDATVYCDIPNALSTCRFGECAVFSCLPGFVDDPEMPGPDCEGEANPADFETTVPCLSDTPCNDADLCNGVETCVEGYCRLGSPIACDAGPTVVQGNFVIDEGRDILALEGIDLITGDLTISGTSLTSLVGLESLRVIGGDLYITGNSDLVRLSGSALSDLEIVGGDIFVGGNPKLTNVALPSLVSAHSLAIVSNDSLAQINANDFANLANIDRLIQIESNPMLQTIAGFEGIGRIDGGYDDFYGGCVGSGGLEIEYNQNLVSLDAFSSLTEVGGDLCVSGNYGLADLSLPDLETVGMNVNLYDLALTHLDLSGLTTVGSDFAMGGEGGFGALTAISFPSLVEVGDELGCWVYGGDIETISLPNLVNVGGVTFNLSNLDQLTAVDISSLQTAGSLSLSYYPSATPPPMPVWSFPALVSINSFFSVNMYGEVTDIGAPLLESTGSFGINITSDSLETIEFPVLTEANGDFSVAVTSTNANVLSNVDFGSLTRVAPLGTSLNSATFQTPTNALDIGEFVGVGADYSGTITLNVAPYDVCADASRIVSNPAFMGTLSEDFGCF